MAAIQAKEKRLSERLTEVLGPVMASPRDSAEPSGQSVRQAWLTSRTVTAT